jgi:MoaA/NifB/PqqE/SkfB family radical SAM enzyme
LQKDGSCPVTQPRIKFTPSPEEIAEVALLHIGEVKDPVVSFGQGCEGEPLMAGDTLVKAVRLIRKRTGKGVINLNTNASRPEYISRLFDEGLDSIRVSMNSFRSRYYMAYYRPRGYDLSDVLSSIRNAKKRKGFVSVNYLVMPGFTDAPEEYDGLCSFIEGMEVDMVQWRNLNYDPRRYFSRIKAPFGEAGAMGIGNVIRGAHERFPGLMKGYFNPSLARMRRAGKKIKT